EPLRLIAISHDVKGRGRPQHCKGNRVGAVTDVEPGITIINIGADLTVGIGKARVVLAVAVAKARMRAAISVGQLMPAVPIAKAPVGVACDIDRLRVSRT